MVTTTSQSLFPIGFIDFWPWGALLFSTGNLGICYITVDTEGNSLYVEVSEHPVLCMVIGENLQIFSAYISKYAFYSLLSNCQYILFHRGNKCRIACMWLQGTRNHT